MHETIFCYHIPDGVKVIKDAAFGDCFGLTSVCIPSSITSIGDAAFYGCASILSLITPNSITTIGEEAFYCVPNIVYSGTAAGAPWGAKSMNGHVEGTFVYADATKTSLLACNRMAKGAITIPNSVTSIGDNAFYCCNSITSIIIPNSVTSIGEGAFRGCEGLTSVTIPNSVTSIGSSAFCGCTGLTAVTIPNSVTSIGDYAFCGCTGLTAITIPEGVTSIEYEAFSRCIGLTSIVIPNSVTSLGDNAFSFCTGLTSISIGDGVATIEKNTFRNCTGLTSVTIGKSVTSIDKSTFEDCDNIASVVWNAKCCKIYCDEYNTLFHNARRTITSFMFGNEVDSIPDYLCYKMAKLTSVTIPNSVTSIGSSAFEECNGLTSVIIPNSVTSIGDYAFKWCEGLKSVTIGNNVTRIGDIAFGGCKKLADIVIPNSVTTIGEWAFAECRNFTSITIPNSVTSIGEHAFRGVPNIVYFGTATGTPWDAKSINGYIESNLVYADATKAELLACYISATDAITIPNSVITIGNEAFCWCTGLTSVFIPNSVTTIGEDAFSRCTGLTSVSIPNSVISIGERAFNDVPNIVYSGTATGTPWDARNMNAYAEDYFVYADAGKANLLVCSTSVTGNITIPNSVITIGDSAFYECSRIQSVTIPNSVTSIGNCAFLGCSELTSVSIPNSVTSIGWGTFDCTNLTSITIPNSIISIKLWAFDITNVKSIICQAVEPPTADDGAFINHGAEIEYSIPSIPLYVPAESIDKYAAVDVWKDFMEIKAISATPVEVDEPILTPEENKVTITWPTTDNADTYTIDIHKGDILICTLTFNANGALQSMRFAAPSRYATQHTAWAEATSNGFRFVVEGLDCATTYAYSITATDKDETVLTNYSGTFTTKTPTGTEDILSSPSQPTTRKVFRNGQVYILRGDKTYNLCGTEVK